MNCRKAVSEQLDKFNKLILKILMSKLMIKIQVFLFIISRRTCCMEEKLCVVEVLVSLNSKELNKRFEIKAMTARWGSS